MLVAAKAASWLMDVSCGSAALQARSSSCTSPSFAAQPCCPSISWCAPAPLLHRREQQPMHGVSPVRPLRPGMLAPLQQRFIGPSLQQWQAGH
jgi:hypothetical protein